MLAVMLRGSIGEVLHTQRQRRIRNKGGMIDRKEVTWIDLDVSTIEAEHPAALTYCPAYRVSLHIHVRSLSKSSPADIMET